MSPSPHPFNRSSTTIPLTTRGIFFCVLAIILAGLVYLNALHNPFVYDDHPLIEDNSSLTNVLDIRAIVLHAVTRPLVNFTYAVDRGAWGPAPFGFHVTNVAIHMINVGLLFLLAWRAMEDRPRTPSVSAARRAEVAAVSTAVLFAVHPMMTEAVGYISGRTDLLSTMFVLMALLAGREWMQTRQAAWKIAASGCWMLGLLCNETAVVFPLVLIWYGLVVRHDPPAQRREDISGFYAPLVFVGLMLAALRLAVFFLLEHPGTAVHWRFALVDADVVTRYLSLLLVPNGQTIFHAVVPVTSVTDPRAILALISMALLVFVMITTRRTAPMASLGLFWFLVTLVPAAALVIFNRAEPMAERRAYLASAGLFLTAGAAMSRMWLGFASGPPRARLLLRIAAVAAVFSLSGRTLVRNATFSDPVTLWAEAAEQAPGHWLPALVLGESLHAAGRHREAIVALNRAVHLNPEEPAGYAKLGVCLLEVGEVDAAESVFDQLQRLDPRSPLASNGLAAVALARQQPALAKPHFLQTLQFDAHNIEARRGLALIAETYDHNRAEALKQCQEIHALAPATPGNDACLSRNDAKRDGVAGRSRSRR